MKKNKIRLTESKLRNIIYETVKSMLRENDFDYEYEDDALNDFELPGNWYNSKAKIQAQRDIAPERENLYKSSHIFDPIEYPIPGVESDWPIFDTDGEGVRHYSDKNYMKSKRTVKYDKDTKLRKKLMRLAKQI